MPFALATFVSDKFYLDKFPYMVCQFSILGFSYHFRLKPLKVNFLVLFRRVSVCKLLGVLREFLCVMTFRHLHDLCEWGAKEGLSRLRRVFKVTEDQPKKRSSQEDCNLSNYRRETRENFRLRQHSNPGLLDTN